MPLVHLRKLLQVYWWAWPLKQHSEPLSGPLKGYFYHEALKDGLFWEPTLASIVYCFRTKRRALGLLSSILEPQVKCGEGIFLTLLLLLGYIMGTSRPSALLIPVHLSADFFFSTEAMGHISCDLAWNHFIFYFLAITLPIEHASSREVQSH